MSFEEFHPCYRNGTILAIITQTSLFKYIKKVYHQSATNKKKKKKKKKKKEKRLQKRCWKQSKYINVYVCIL